MNPYLGIALGAGVGEWHNQENNRRRNDQMELLRQREARELASHDQQMQVGALNLEQGQMQMSNVKDLQRYQKALQSAQAGQFNNPALLDVLTERLGAHGLTPTFGNDGVSLVGPDGNVVQQITQDQIPAAIEKMVRQQAQIVDPANFYRDASLQMDQRKLDMTGEAHQFSMEEGRALLPARLAQMQAQTAAANRANRPQPAQARSPDVIGYTPAGLPVMLHPGGQVPFTLAENGSPAMYTGPVTKSWSPDAAGIDGFVPVQGNPGVFRDTKTNQLHRLDEGDGGLSEVPFMMTDTQGNRVPVTADQRAFMASFPQMKAARDAKLAEERNRINQLYGQIPGPILPPDPYRGTVTPR